jgi:hypothetical protein
MEIFQQDMGDPRFTRAACIAVAITVFEGLGVGGVMLSRSIESGFGKGALAIAAGIIMCAPGCIQPRGLTDRGAE